MSRKYRRLKRYGFRCREKLPYAILNFEWEYGQMVTLRNLTITNIEIPALEIPLGTVEFKNGKAGGVK